MTKTKVLNPEKRHALVLRAKIDGKENGYVCPYCHIGWAKKSDVPSECPCCSTIFDGIDSEGETVKITTRKRALELKAQRKEEEKLVKAIEREEEKKAKAKAKAKEKKAKERAKAKEKARKEKLKNATIS